MKNIFKLNSIYFTLILFGAMNVFANACPPPPSSVSPKLSSQVSFDKKLQLYKYQYKMANGADAQIPLDYFGLLLGQAPQSSLSGANWNGSFLTQSYAANRFRWTTFAVKASEANVVTGDGALSPPIYAIQPGKSLDGFEISSTQPPGVVQFFAQGFTQPAASIPTASSDEPTPNCPGWDSENSQILTQVTGAITGPSDPDVISVKLRAREETGLHSCAPINPKGPGGKMAVLILSTSSFDATQVNVPSIMFGPGYVAPILSKVMDRGVGEKVDSDERADWEKIIEILGPDAKGQKKVNYKNLLLIFDVASLDVQCNLDQALFMRGKTNSGQKFIGAVSANTVGCGTKDIGKHKKHKLPYKWWKT